MTERITVVVDQPRTITNVTTRNVATAVRQTAGVTTLQRENVATTDVSAVAVPVRTSQTATVAVAGLQGPPGQRGLPGLGSNTAVIEQITPASVWDIVHGLGQFPSVTTVDSAGSQVFGAITYVSSNELTITFTSAMAGSAYLN